MATCSNAYNTFDGNPIPSGAEVKAVITLGEGNNIAEMLNSPDTQVPEGITLYSGADVNYIPHGLVGSSRDLVIHVEEGILFSGISVRYYDVTSDMWVGPITPRLFLTNGSLNWGSWKDFANSVIPFKSVITMLGAFVEDAPEDEPDNGFDGTVDDTLDPDSDNPISNKAVAQALDEVNANLEKVSATMNAVVTGLQTGGVGYSMVEIDGIEEQK